jgi:hypothetical protein
MPRVGFEITIRVRAMYALHHAVSVISYTALLWCKLD